jgi:nitrogen regulatory protein PII-like uncharacterized protein
LSAGKTEFWIVQYRGVSMHQIKQTFGFFKEF